MSGLSVRGATVRFGAMTALDAVDLDLAPGEVLAVLGPSGSGKSTLLRAIAGLQPMDAGTIALGDRPLAGVPPHQRGVGLMFQDHALFPHRDVAGNVAFGLRMQRRPKAEIAARVDELLSLVGLAGFGHRAIRTLSGGEQQRVALARALAPRPSLLLLDEPLGALDRSLRDRLVSELRQLFTDLGISVIAVTHDQVEAFALADRLVVMDAGRVLQTGSPAAVWGSPRTVRVASLLGLANLAEGTVSGGLARTPWGDVPVEAPDGPVAVLLRSSGLVVDPAGPITGRVTARTFQGARTVLRVEVPDAPPLEVEVATAAAPEAGATVHLRIGATAVVVLEP